MMHVDQASLYLWVLHERPKKKKKRTKVIWFKQEYLQREAKKYQTSVGIFLLEYIEISFMDL